VTVNTIAPGFIETPMTDALNDKQKDSILGSVPAGRLGRASRNRGCGPLPGKR
jgi:3-oxoacyl-[acyl-carrier protein] reductase